MSNAAVLWWGDYYQKNISIIGDSSERNSQISDIGDTQTDKAISMISAIGINVGFMYYKSANTSSIGQQVPSISLIGELG